MLKIKDNVDLKELEKFGFIHIDKTQMVMPRYRRGRVTIFYDCWYDFPGGAENANKTRVQRGFSPILDRVIYIDDLDAIEEDSLNDVFDLIQAGLVEKGEDVANGNI
ncbi:MAG: hypothetical protein M0Q88_00175 [Bacilli bacterium]|nr:hypothetical protein [Bacilli bacterium]